MNTDSNSINDTDDLAAFEQEFFGKANTEPVKEEAVESDLDAEDTSSEEDALATNEPDTETDAEVDDNETDDEGEAPVEKPKKKTAQERISELTQKYREAERKAAELERQLREREAPTPVEDNGNVNTPASNEPTPDDLNEDGSEKYPLGEYDPTFIKDLIKFTNDQIVAERDAEAQTRSAQQAQQEAQAALNQEWTEKLNQAEKGEFADIREVGIDLVEAFSDLDPAYGEYLASTIMTLDKGVEVFHYLATHLDEAREIVAAGPNKATIALGRLEARFLTDETGNRKPKVTKAPEPPRSINRGASGKFEIPDDTDDLEAFEKKFFAKKR